MTKPKLRSFSLVEQFLDKPSDITGKALVLGKHYVTPGEDRLRIDVKQLKSGAYTIFFQKEINSEAWGFVTVHADKTLRLFKGDHYLWGSQLGSPSVEEAMTFKNGSSSQGSLTLREFDGGSSGYQENLRVFIPGNDGEWTAAGSVPLSHAWRSPNFPDLAGAETPYEHRDVEIAFQDTNISVTGTEQIVRRLPDQPKVLEIERVTLKISEAYRVHNGKIEKLSRHSHVTSKQRDRIPRGASEN